ncbi:hypothetical protein DFH27DRAFT_544605 [Peziza echinospora]|nr:hypothetical protein DFH27DRAFT_544605 [Peziza echinospora]
MHGLMHAIASWSIIKFVVGVYHITALFIAVQWMVRWTGRWLIPATSMHLNMWIDWLMQWPSGSYGRLPALDTLISHLPFEWTITMVLYSFILLSSS